MKTVLYLLTCCIIYLSFCLLSSCNHPETIAVSEDSFKLPDDSSVIYRLDKRYFLLIPGDTALFYGSNTCSVFTNGLLKENKKDSLVLRTIVFPTDTGIVNNIITPIYKQRYEYVSSLKNLAKKSKIPDNTITRYFIRNDTAILQIKYVLYESNDKPKDSTIQIIPDNQQKVIPRIVQVGKYGFFQTDSTNIPTSNTWYTSPLIHHPYFTKKDFVRFDGFSVAILAIALKFADTPYIVNGKQYSNGLKMETYYSLAGEYSEKGRNVRIDGSIKIVRTYFADVGMCDQSMKSVIHTIFSDTVQIVKDSSYIARGPEGAKYYPEHIYP